jgi:Tfp pilus assembly protein PilV
MHRPMERSMRPTQAQGVPNAQAVPFRPELSAEHGVTLVETLLSAAILLIVLFAVLSSLDAASRTTAVNKSRTVAAGLAERDLERLRSMPTTTLARFSGQEDTEVVDGTTYTVNSRAEWVHDRSGTAASCDSDGKQADYIKLTSTVTSGVLGKRVKPVELTSIVAPRVGSFGANQGTLAVQVKNEVDAPVSSLPVTINGPGTFQDNTNQLGCAVFGHVPAGAYTVTLDQSGWVDKDGNQTSTQTTNVAAGTKNTVSMQYAQAATVTVAFETEVRGSRKGASSPALTAANPGMTSGRKVIPASGGNSGTITASGLYPFTDGYTFFSGACPGSSPTTFVPDYFDTHPGYLKVAAGGTASVTVREPSFNLRVTRGPNANSAAPFRDGYVVIASADSGCSDRYVFDGLNPNGTLPDSGVGLPFGTYRVCADDRKVVSRTSDRRYVTMDLVVSDKPEGLDHETNGDPKLKLWINSSNATRGFCS